jgi:hypothetical protein
MNRSLKKWSDLKVYESLTLTNKEVVLFRHNETNQLFLEDHKAFIMPELKHALEAVEKDTSQFWPKILRKASRCILKAKETNPEYLNSFLHQKSFVENLLVRVMPQNMFGNPERCFHLFILSSASSSTLISQIFNTIGNEYLDERFYNKSTALHISIFYKVFSSCKVSLERGANPNIKDENGETPLMIAVEYLESLEFVEILLQHGANVNIENNSGLNPLDLANLYVNSKIKQKCIQLLMKAQIYQNNLRKKQFSKRQKLENIIANAEINDLFSSYL